MLSHWSILSLSLAGLASGSASGQGCGNTPCCSPTSAEKALQECPVIATCVGNFDPFCTTGTFDAQCVAEAQLAECGLNCAQPAPQPPTVITTPSGTVKGTLAETGVVVFSIPYAEAPVGPLRFMAPVSKAVWEGTLDVPLAGHVCPQKKSLLVSPWPFDAPENKQSEDCLFVNVYVPPGAGEGPPLPVFVWVHGGSFVSGDAKTVKPATFAELNNVIVVGVNYRLGALGFFPFPQLAGTGSLGSGGLNGMLDVIMGLEWIQTHIGSFGGDPHSVSLGGQSAGSILVCVLNVSPLAAGLFQRVVQMSGSCAGLWGPMPATMGVVNANEVLQAAQLLEKPLTVLQALPLEVLLLFPALPAVDGHVINKMPVELYAAGLVHTTSVLLGTTSQDSIFKAGDTLNGIGLPPLKDGLLNASSYEATLRQVFGDNATRDYMFETAYPTANLPFSYYDLGDDACMQCPMLMLKSFLETAAQKGGETEQRVFQYRYAFPTYGEGGPWEHAAVHQAGLTTLWGYTTKEGQFPYPKAWYSNFMMNVFGEFVRTGNIYYDEPGAGLVFTRNGVDILDETYLASESQCAMWDDPSFTNTGQKYFNFASFCSGMTGVSS